MTLYWSKESLEDLLSTVNAMMVIEITSKQKHT